jgi:hypothetical protein
LTWLFAAVALLTASPLNAQAPAPTVTDSVLTEFAALHLSIVDARDEFYDALGRTHDDIGKDELRAEFELTLDELFELHEKTREEYDRIIYVVSSDDDRRAAWERILEEVKSGGGGL